MQLSHRLGETHGKGYGEEVREPLVDKARKRRGPEEDLDHWKEVHESVEWEVCKAESTVEAEALGTDNNPHASWQWVECKDP